MKKQSNILTIFKKELSRFFGDKRMVITTVLLPGLLIYIVYSFMGSAMTDMFHTGEDYRLMTNFVNLPESVSSILNDANGEELSLDVTEIKESDVEQAKSFITEKDLDLLVVFPEDFDARVETYEAGSGEAAPQVEIYFNSTRTESTTAFGVVAEILDAYESSLANKFDVNALGGEYDLATEKDATGFMFSSMLPLLLMIFLFTGCMSVAPESIAGEKERGTIATMLITPVKRSELAIGKILALALIALLAGASSTLGTMLALPKLMAGAGDSMSAAYYGATDYAMLLLIALSTVLLFISIISVLSAYAKTIKEAQTTVMPLMIIVMIVGVTGMFSGNAKEQLYYYLIPVYNSVQSMVGIFSFGAGWPQILTTVVVNLLLSVGCGVALTKMFDNEKIMFN